MKPYYEHGGVTIFHGDCREVLPSLTADALVTDPPYGVGFSGKVCKEFDHRGADAYEDTEERFREVVLPAARLALTRATRAAIFTGVRRLHEYPTPSDIGGIVCPNGAGRSPWGFGCFNPVLFYGSPPAPPRPTATVIYHPGMHKTGEQNGHPCPKPVAFMRWAVARVTVSGDSVLDPFAGSGTTLVVAKHLGLRAIGVEIEERYCEIAAKRLAQETLPFSAQPRPLSLGPAPRSPRGDHHE